MSRGEVQIDDAVVVINIHQQFPFAQNAEDLKECTRGLWRLDAKRGGRAKYLFGVYKGKSKKSMKSVNAFQPEKKPKTTGVRDFFRKAKICRRLSTTTAPSLMSELPLKIYERNT